MNKEDNVYFNLAEKLKQNNNNIQNVNLGIVKSISPLIINCNGLQLDKEDLLVNKELENKITVNSTVLLLTSDNQKFYLVCEVI